ncbi:uncharacterized protein METZ01_LOCUS223201, partial [marine metagenome]
MSVRMLSGNIGFVGTGALGCTMARAMHNAGYRVASVTSRTAASAEQLAMELDGCEAMRTPQDVADCSHVVFLTVPDNIIESVTNATQWRSGQAVVHCSGATPLSVLNSAKNLGALVGAIHPLQTFGGTNEAPVVMQGIAYAIEAESSLDEDLATLATDLGGWPIALAAEDRVLYHASATAACGLLAILVKLSSGLWSDFIQSNDEGLRSLLPLVFGTLDSIERRGFPDALTGPMARGDIGTVASHLEALSTRAPEFQLVYSHLMLASLLIARDKGGLGQNEEDQLRELL